MRRVLKIGGSLLLRPHLVHALRAWIAEQPTAETIAIVGGGEMIEAVRRLDANYQCDPIWVHWQCVRMLRTTFELLRREFEVAEAGDWRSCENAEQFQQLQHSHGLTESRSKGSRPTGSQTLNHLVAVDSFYHPDCDAPLPNNWDTTTDAIAGWLAHLVRADELVLLKSCDTDPTATLAELSEQGVIDKAFQRIESGLCPVRLVNFASNSLGSNEPAGNSKPSRNVAASPVRESA